MVRTVKNVAPIVLAVFVASAVLAHDGVKNPAVMARMDAMVQVGAGMKVLGQMSKGAVPFDAEAARAAAVSIAKHASDTPRLFEAREDDPKSEALPAIWDNFNDFTTKSKAMEVTALRHAEGINSPETLGLAVSELGATCQSCHKAYRE